VPDQPAHLSERLRAEGQKTVEFFGSLTPEQWNLTVYTEGPAWTARQVLAHFVSAEHSFGRLVNDVATGGPGAPESFDIDGFNLQEVASLGDLSPAELLARFTDIRAQTTARVAQLEVADLERLGRHPFLGVVPLAEIIKLVYRHNQLHQRDLRRALSSTSV
jgi:uncharacterized protein (TIGR03083 family)